MRQVMRKRDAHTLVIPALHPAVKFDASRREMTEWAVCIEVIKFHISSGSTYPSAEPIRNAVTIADDETTESLLKRLRSNPDSVDRPPLFSAANALIIISINIL